MASPSRSAAFFASLPEGTRLSVPAVGRSMVPLLWGGEVLEVERCSPASLRRGDIAVVRSPEDLLVAHLVVDVAPLRTSTFRGVVDAGSTEILGRVRSVRRGRLHLPLGRYTPSLLFPLHRLAAASTGRQLEASLRAASGMLLRSGVGRALRRRRFLPISVTSLKAPSTAVLALLGTEGLHPRPSDGELWISAQDPRGALVGVAWISPSGAAGVVVSPVARRLGIGRRLMAELVLAARSAGVTPIQVAHGPAAFLRAAGFAPERGHWVLQLR